MKDYERIFDWVELDEGRAQFAGGIRGVDECGHETFAVQMEKRTYYGEIKKTFLPDKNNYNLEILSFGYSDRGDVGMPMREPIVAVFSDTEIERIKRLIVGYVRKASAWKDRPSVLSESKRSLFMRKIFFREGWILMRANGQEIGA